MTDWLLIAVSLATLGCFGVIFVLALAEYRASEPLRKHDRKACPWPVDDEAERAVRLCEFQGSHSTSVASGAPQDHA
jgi:hypothetical protein